MSGPLVGGGRVKRRLHPDLEEAAAEGDEPSPRRTSRRARATPDRLGMGPTSTHVSARASGDPSSSQSVTQVAAASRSVAAAAEKRQRKLLVALKNPAGSFQQNPTTSANVAEPLRSRVAPRPPAGLDAFSDDETDVGGRDGVASPVPQTLLKRDSLQQRIRAKLDLSDWAITSAIKESFLGSPEPKNHRLTQENQNSPTPFLPQVLVLLAVIALLIFWWWLDWWLPLVAELSQTARFALLWVLPAPDLFSGGGGSRGGEDDIVRQLSKYGASPSTPPTDHQQTQGFSMDKLEDALVTSSKFQDFVSRAATASSQDSASKIQALVSKYESDMLQQLDSVKKLNDLEKERFRLDFDKFKENFADHLAELENTKLPFLHKKVDQLTSTNQDAAALLQRRLETLSAEIGATQQQIHDIKVSEVGPSSGLEGGTSPPSQEMKEQMTVLDQRLGNLMEQYNQLTVGLKDCQGKPDVSFQEVGENLAKVLTESLKSSVMSVSEELPETRRLVSALKSEFVAGETVEAKINEANQALKEEILNKVQAEVLSSDGIRANIHAMVRQTYAEREPTIPQVPQFSKEELAEIVSRKIVTYDADKTGLFDFALESAGGTIETVRCTKTYDKASAVYTVWGVPIWSEGTEPGMVLRPGTSPGQCWAFRGSTGTVVIRLSSPVAVSAVTIEHIPSTLSPDGSVNSAPKDFSVHGLHSVNEANPSLLGNYTYAVDGGKDPIQTFEVDTTAHPKQFFPLVEVTINSNHGNKDYTCLYRIRVHGKIQVPDSTA